MIDINLLRTNPELVKENIKKKFQDSKLPLVDEVISLDKENRSLKQEGDELRALRNKLSGEVGMLMREKKIVEAEEIKAKVKQGAERLAEIEAKQIEIDGEIKKRMMLIPNIIGNSYIIRGQNIGKLLLISDNNNILCTRKGQNASCKIYL